MGKAHTTLTVDHDLLMAAKASGINMSQLLDESLRGRLQMEEAENEGHDVTDETRDAIRVLNVHQYERMKLEIGMNKAVAGKWQRIIQHMSGHKPSKAELLELFHKDD